MPDALPDRLPSTSNGVLPSFDSCAPDYPPAEYDASFGRGKRVYPVVIFIDNGQAESKADIAQFPANADFTFGRFAGEKTFRL